MHPRVFEEFERICRTRGAGGDVLEIGAVPSRESLLFLPALSGARSRIGVDLAVVDEPVLDAVLDRLERPTWERTELLLLACPPAHGSSVALRLAEVADAVLIVAGERTPRADLVRTAGRLRRLDTGELLVLLTIDA